MENEGPLLFSVSGEHQKGDDKQLLLLKNLQKSSSRNISVDTTARIDYTIWEEEEAMKFSAAPHRRVRLAERVIACFIRPFSLFLVFRILCVPLFFLPNSYVYIGL